MFIKDVNKAAFLSQFETALDAALAGTEFLDSTSQYACKGGGKRVRPMCVYYGASAINGECDIDGVLALAIGLELIHNYSLVHDDLPAMDDDYMRRGKPTVHAKFGEANAILTGDLLLTRAMEVLFDGAKKYGEKFVAAASEIVFGAKRMVYGQYKDLGHPKNKDEYFDMCSDKTGALIRAAFRAAAIYAGADEKKLSDITQYAEALGLIFQITDDRMDDDGLMELLDIESVNDELLLQIHRALSFSGNHSELSDLVNKLASRKA